MLCILFDLCCVCIFMAKHIACVFDHGALHAIAQTKVRNLLFSTMLNCQNLSFDPSRTKPTRNHKSIQFFQLGFVLFILLRVQPLEHRLFSMRPTCMLQRLNHRNICIRKRECSRTEIFSNNPNLHLVFCRMNTLHHLLPFLKRGSFLLFHPKRPQNLFSKLLPFKHEWNFVNR